MLDDTSRNVGPADRPFSRAQTPPRSGQLSTLLAVLVLLAVVWLLPRFLENVQYSLTRGRQRAEVDIARQQLGEHKLADLASAFELVAQSIGPSVVHIDTVKMVRGGGAQDEWAFHGGLQQQYRSEEQGSGVIVDAAGYVLTNNHVVQGAHEVTVHLSDGRARPAQVVGFDPPTDLAVLKLDADNLVPAPWGNSDKLKVGSPVFAVGNPYGLDRSVTFGIISATSRRASAYQDFLQTDAAVNPGNSGGPLVNLDGEVVGINTAIVGQSYQGISFAIPSNTAREVYQRLKSQGHVARGYLGVDIQSLDTRLAEKLGLADTSGALVRGVAPQTPAANAGIQTGDVIVEWNGQAVDNDMTLRLLVAKTEVGAEAKCVLVRDGQRQELAVTVGALPQRSSR